MKHGTLVLVVLACLTGCGGGRADKSQPAAADGPSTSPRGEPRPKISDFAGKWRNEGADDPTFFVDADGKGSLVRSVPHGVESSKIEIREEDGRFISDIFITSESGKTETKRLDFEISSSDGSLRMKEVGSGGSGPSIMRKVE